MSNRSPLLPTQKAMYTYLSADTGLANALQNFYSDATRPLIKVYDQVPEGTPYPYVEIFRVEATKDDTLGDIGRDMSVDILAYSQAPGYQELQVIQQELARLLDEQTMPNTTAAFDPANGWAVDWHLIKMEELVRLDGITRQLQVQVSLLVHRIALGE